LSAHIQFFVHWYPQALLCRTVLNQLITQSVLILGITLTQVQHLALGLFEFHEICMGPVRVPLDGIPFLKLINCSFQLDVAEVTLNLTIYVIKEDIKQY